MTKVTKIFKAVLSNDIGGLVKLLKDGTSSNTRDRDGRTPLMHATVESNAALASVLITHGADVNLVDSHGWSALHFAAQESDIQIASILLEHGAQVDAQDDHGNTPLNNAVFSSRGRGDLIKLFLSRGADKELKNKYGISPLDLAESIGNYDVAQFLNHSS